MEPEFTCLSCTYSSVRLPLLFCWYFLGFLLCAKEHDPGLQNRISKIKNMWQHTSLLQHRVVLLTHFTLNRTIFTRGDRCQSFVRARNLTSSQSYFAAAIPSVKMYFSKFWAPFVPFTGLYYDFFYLPRISSILSTESRRSPSIICCRVTFSSHWQKSIINVNSSSSLNPVRELWILCRQRDAR